LLTEAQVADGMSISPRTLQQWRYLGGGPRYLKIGSAVRYRPEDVAAWLAQQTKASTSDPGPEAA
jgi:predicted DNA-binding transcriptional regulator AlpA